MSKAYAQLAFTPRVRDLQARHGSAEAYGRLMEAAADSGHRLGARESSFLQARDGFFQATTSETGWPYVQFRGGKPGFLKVIDSQTLAYADYRGNKQYISAGNLGGDGRISLLAIDYANQTRLKLLGRAELSEDPKLIAALNFADGPPAERAVTIHIDAFDWNCPKHIPQRLTDAEYGGELARLRARIAELEAKAR